MQFLKRNPWRPQSMKSLISLAEYVREYQTNAIWDVRCSPFPKNAIHCCKVQLLPQLNLCFLIYRYFDAVQNLLKPRFEFVFFQHIHSVQTCDTQKLGQIDLQPHFISRRYAELCAAVIALNEQGENDQAVRWGSNMAVHAINQYTLRLIGRIGKPLSQ